MVEDSFGRRDEVGGRNRLSRSVLEGVVVIGYAFCDGAFFDRLASNFQGEICPFKFRPREAV